LDTFGFRGEALSSLCSLSNLFIVTRNAKSTKATKIEYDQNGMIRTKTSCARSVGTTVQLEKLFYSLPVRHKEFLKNLKKDYHKLLYVVQSYCLISEGIKLSLYHVMQDKSTKLMSTQSKNNLKDNIIEIFGSK
jgi:DNA mismatch repair protein PMS2